MGIPLFQVDSFTDQPFGGNPAGVCMIPEARPDDWMRSVAAEMNLSETAFLMQQDDGYRLRWFTPEVEVELCGHATLASAHILWEQGYLPLDQEARFNTLSGLLTARRDGSWIQLNFPATPVERSPEIPELQTALGTQVSFTGKSLFDYLCEVEDEETLRNLKPDFSSLKTLPVRGIIVTAQADPGEYDFVSRFFAPAVGINEDPVTGSAHSTLAPYWSERLGKKHLNAYQASKRGGFLRLTHQEDRVLICGQAVTILKGELT